MKSLSEIETTAKRASKAAGYSWGVSEETGKSIRLLELFSLPGIKHLNEYFNEKNKSKFENLKKIEFKNVAYPIIFISFISRSSEIIGKKIYVKMDEKEILLNLNVNISSNFIEQEFPKLVNTIEVNLLENEDNFTDDEWNNLYKLSEKTFVEESDSLKEGAAGAGLTDND